MSMTETTIEEPTDFRKPTKTIWRWYQWTSTRAGQPLGWVATCWDGPTREAAIAWKTCQAACGIFDGKTPAKLVREDTSYSEIIGEVYP